jgi:hypothetical protein
MTETTSGSAPGATKPCRVCGEEIKAVARKCIHCDSYQDWHADVNVSSTFLSLMVALFSVLTVAVPVITAALTPKNSDLSFSFQGANARTLGVLVTNQGIRPGSVQYPIGLAVSEKGMSNILGVIPLSLVGNGDNAALIVGSAQTLLLNLAYENPPFTTNNPPLERLDELNKYDCDILLQKTDFNAKKSTTEDIGGIDCYNLSDFLTQAIAYINSKKQGVPSPTTSSPQGNQK